ncbi:TonB-dependent receptor plug domain-containing protein [Maricaulis sp.]|uniref:TonB-dependent receptor plug domain-containing protein n=1 Tax=Maricaulis sp. TaxID=1486257 RepID=UPI002B276F04|nr:TonB-dependent receptor [Maricaulis sp.]
MKCGLFILSNAVSRAVAASFALAVSSMAPAWGQAADENTGIAVYRPDAFAEFLPRNALDMVYRLPGFSLNGGDNVRGLSGAAGNVLINGRRPPRGSGSLDARIRAIRVEDVLRLELIEAGARDVEMQGYPLLLNIVTTQTSATRVDGRIEIEPREDGGEEYQGELAASITGGRFELEARLDLYDETITDYGSVRTSTADEPTARISSDELEGFTRRDWLALARYHANPRNDFEFSLSTERRDNTSTPVLDSGSPAGTIEAGASESIARFGSARWRHDFSDTVELIGLVTRRQGEAVASNSLLSSGVSSQSASTRETRETAARADLRWRPGRSLTLETGVTWATNMLEGRSSAFIDGVEQAVDGADAQVEETRSALLASATWIPSPRISATIGTRFEQFSLESSNQGGASLSLTDIAPRADINWSVTERWTLRLSSERNVGQLDLDQFLASTDLDNALNTAGASTLEPQRDWTHTATLERRSGERDLLRLEAVAQEIENPISSILDGDGSVRPANVGPESIQWVNAEFELELDRYGLPGLSVEGSANRRWSDRIDQLQGFARTTSGHRDYSIKLVIRKEWSDGRYVASFEVEDRAPAMHYWLTEIREESNGVRLRLDSEWRHVPAWRSGFFMRWNGDRRDTIQVFDGVREPGVDPVLVNTIDRSEGVFASVWSEWEVREAGFLRLSLRSGRDNAGVSRVDTPSGAFLDQITSQSDNVPSLNVRLRFQR